MPHFGEQAPVKGPTLTSVDRERLNLAAPRDREFHRDLLNRGPPGLFRHYAWRQLAVVGIENRVDAFLAKCLSPSTLTGCVPKECDFL